MDVERQVEYWRTGSVEDLAAAEALAVRHPRHALFLAHLALEKVLKAHVTRTTGDVPPRIHDLLRLVDLAGLSVSSEQRTFLARFQQYCLAGRYPDLQRGQPEPAAVAADSAHAREMHSWLLSLLS